MGLFFALNPEEPLICWELMTCLQPVCVEAFFPAGWLCDMQPPLTERYSLYCVWFHRGDGSNKGTRPPRRHHASDKGPQPRRQCQFATVLLTALVACRRWTSLAALLHHERREEKRREEKTFSISETSFASSFHLLSKTSPLIVHCFYTNLGSVAQTRIEGPQRRTN